jgi:uncharacterized membrane protein YphA (DoxX/SURF4 family)
MSLLRILGRLSLAVIFIIGGFSTLTKPGYRAKALANVGLPQSDLLVRANGLTMVGGGLLLVSGIAPTLAASILAVALIPTTIAGHAFWKESDPQVRLQQLTHFTKNLGLVGGLLLELELERQHK